MIKKLLFVEDQSDVRKYLTQLFKEDDWHVSDFNSAEDAMKHSSAIDEFDVAVLDYNLPNMDGLELAEKLKERRDGTPIGICILSGAPKAMSKALKSGRLNFTWLDKPSDKEDRNKLLETLNGLLERVRAGHIPLASPPTTPAALAESGDFYVDKISKEIRNEIERNYGPSLMRVLIIGDSGTGKEAVARLIHDNSPLRDGKFLAVNCAEFTETLILSELFGHVDGAFTGAIRNHLGVIMEAAGAQAVATSDDASEEVTKKVLSALLEAKQFDLQDLVKEFHDKGTFYRRVKETVNAFEKIKKGSSASGYIQWLKSCGNRIKLVGDVYRLVMDEKYGDGPTGTLFLDEIADLSPVAQAALLRFLNGDGFRPVGYSGPPLAPRVRIISATNRREILNKTSEDVPDEPTTRQSKMFRSDTFWRLAEWTIELFCLSDRPLDGLYAAQRCALNYGKQYLGGREDFRLQRDAEDELLKMIRNGDFSDKRHRFREGNFRNLLSMIKRACVYTKDRSADPKGITRQDLLDAAQSVTGDLLAARAERQPVDPPAGSPSDNTLETLSTMLKEWLHKHDHDETFGQSTSGLAMEFKLSKAVRDSFDPESEERIDVKFYDFVHNPTLRFGGNWTADAKRRWRYIVLLAILAKAQTEYQWQTIYHLTKVRNKEKFQDLVASILSPFKIKDYWPPSDRKIKGPAIGFVRLLFSREIRPGNGAEEIKQCLENAKQVLFEWEFAKVDETDKDNARNFLDHLQRLADNLGIERPE